MKKEKKKQKDKVLSQVRGQVKTLHAICKIYNNSYMLRSSLV